MQSVVFQFVESREAGQSSPRRTPVRVGVRSRHEDCPVVDGVILSSIGNISLAGFCLNFAMTPRQDRPVDTIFCPDIAFVLLVGEHLTVSEQRVLLSVCLFWRSCIAGIVSHTAVGATRSPAWHRNKRAARRPRRASRRGVHGLARRSWPHAKQTLRM